MMPDPSAPSESGAAHARGATLDAAMAAGLLVWAVRLSTKPLHDNSFLTHLATGRRILESGVPTVDPYSFTARGEPWVVQSWFASLLYAQSEAWFGPAGLRLGLALTMVALVACIWALTAPARTVLPRLAVAALAVAVGSGAWSFERPLMFGLLGVAMLLLVVEERLPMWVVLPVMWVWVNTHGSFPLAVVLLVSIGIGRGLDRAPLGRAPKALAFTVAGIVLAAVNPIGPKLLVFPLHLLGQREVLQSVVEWQAASFQDRWMLAYLVLVAVSIAALVRRPSWSVAVPLLVFVPLSLLAMRNIGVAVVVLVPGAARGLADLGSIRGDDRSTLGAALAGSMVALGATLLAIGVTSSPDIRYDAYPIDALAHLDERGVIGDGDRTRLITHDYVGNVMEQLDLGEPVFFDDRFDMYPAAVSADYFALTVGALRWEEVLDRWDGVAVIWHRDQPLESLLLQSTDWRLVWTDDTFRAFCRRGAQGC